MKKSLLLLISLFSVTLGACGTGGIKYLKKGETNNSGNLSQTIQEFKYLGDSDDKKQVIYVLSYKLHSSYDKTMSLSGLIYYSAIFDEVSGNGGISWLYPDAIFPKSIAPDSDETIKFAIVGFSDWEKVVISYNDSQTGINYSFGLNRADY